MERTMTELVERFYVERMPNGEWTKFRVHTVGSRGTQRTSKCEWNTEAAAKRHGRALVGRVMG